MERPGRRLALFLRGVVWVLFLAALLEPGSAGMPPLFPLHLLCKFCDVELSSCGGTGTCLTNCSITSICPLHTEVCVSIWRKNESSYSIETLCHDPAKPLYGVVLDDYNSSTCIMKEKNTTGGMAYFCSCSQEEECNEKLYFPPSEYMNPAVIEDDASACLKNQYVTYVSEFTRANRCLTVNVEVELIINHYATLYEL